MLTPLYPSHLYHSYFASSFEGVSVNEQDSDPQSLLNFYRKLLAPRRSHDSLRRGRQRLLEIARTLLVIERALPTERLLIVSNLSEMTVTYRGPGSLGGDLIEGGHSLRRFQTDVFRAGALSRRDRP